MKNMNAKRQKRMGLVGLAWVLAAATGCQTWVAGMTLPTGFYLQHPPQYIPPSPPFPLPRKSWPAGGKPPWALAPGGWRGLPPPIPGRP